MKSLLKTRIPIWGLLAALSGWLADGALLAKPTEEFIGPLPNWADVRRDHGAVGDGQVDDTAALRQALERLTKHTNSCVLLLPAGTDRITGTLRTIREAHTDCQRVAVIGEDPGRTILRWDGTNGGTMFQWDAWYSKISRLTFDGAGRAGTGLLSGPAFSTYNETSDLVFRDATNGLVFGGPQTEGQVENAVLRCEFLRCGTGIQTVNWNSMDIWVWYGRLEDCGRGVHNVMGNWHVWESLFLRSRIADLSSINLMAFSAVNNTSVGSRCFFDFSTGHSWGSPVSLTGNRVVDPTGDWAVSLDNAGPYLVADNQSGLTGTARALLVEGCDQPRGRIFADQFNINGPGSTEATNAAALRITGLDHTDLLLRSLQGSGHAGRWVEVVGGADAEAATNQVSIFTGATGSAAGQYDVRHGGRLVVRSVYHERSSDSLNGLQPPTTARSASTPHGSPTPPRPRRRPSRPTTSAAFSPSPPAS